MNYLFRKYFPIDIIKLVFAHIILLRSNKPSYSLRPRHMEVNIDYIY